MFSLFEITLREILFDVLLRKQMFSSEDLSRSDYVLHIVCAFLGCQTWILLIFILQVFFLLFAS